MVPFLILCVAFLCLHAPLLRRWPGGSTPADKAAGALAGMLGMTGTLHFTTPERFVGMVPPALGSAETLVFVSGIAELALAAMLLVPPARRFAGWGAVALFVAIWPANVYAALSGSSEFSESATYLWLRVPFQPLYIGWGAWIGFGRLPFARFRQRMFAKYYDKLQAPYEEFTVERRKALLKDARGTAAEIGPGTGVNLPLFGDDVRWIGVEPNPFMRERLQTKARELGRDVELRDLDGDRLPFEDDSVDVVVSTLVLCSVPHPERVLSDIRRVLTPNGRFLFLEHVAAPEGSGLRFAQNVLQPFWSVMADGCCPNRALADVIRGAGFTSVDLEEYRLPRGLAPPVIAPHIMGSATK